MFPHQFNRFKILQVGDKQQHLDFEIKFLTRYDEDDNWTLRIHGRETDEVRRTRTISQ